MLSFVHSEQLKWSSRCLDTHKRTIRKNCVYWRKYSYGNMFTYQKRSIDTLRKQRALAKFMLVNFTFGTRERVCAVCYVKNMRRHERVTVARRLSGLAQVQPRHATISTGYLTSSLHFDNSSKTRIHIKSFSHFTTSSKIGHFILTNNG